MHSIYATLTDVATLISAVRRAPTASGRDTLLRIALELIDDRLSQSFSEGAGCADTDDTQH